MIQPDALKKHEPWMWSAGAGTDVWAMFMACMNGDLDTVKKLIAKDPSLIRSHYEYRTPLSFAVRENQLAVAEFLLDLGAASVGLGDPLEMARDRGYVEMERLLSRKFAELHGASDEGEPVAKAIRDSDLSRVRGLLDASPHLTSAGDRGSNQPIHWATMTRQSDVIDELLGRGADIDAKRLDGARPIHLTNGDYTYRGWRDVPRHVTATPAEVYTHLVSSGANVDVWMAALKGDIDRVRELLDEDPSLVNKSNEYNSYYGGSGSPLKNAAAAGHLEIVKLLLDRSADPNLPAEGIAPNGHALYSAVYSSHYDIVKLLLERGANPNAPAESSGDAVWIAIRDNDLKMIALLASYGATWEIPIDLDGTLEYDDIVATGLRRTVQVLGYFGDVKTASEIFDADPSLTNDPEALKVAAGRNHGEFVQLLLNHQPKLAERVTVSRPREMAEFLFARGMNPNLRNWVERTPLHNFASHGDMDGAGFFIDHGADLNARDDEDRSTPLALAAREGKSEMVAFLLRRGAKARLPDDPEWATAIAWATRRGHDNVVRILTEMRT